MSYTIEIGTDDLIFFRSSYGKTSNQPASWLSSRKFPIFAIFTNGEVTVEPLTTYVRTLTLTNTALSLSGAAYAARNDGTLVEVSKIEKGDVLAGDRGDEKVVGAAARKTEKRALRIVTPEPFLIVVPLLIVFDIESALPLLEKLPHLSFRRWCELRKKRVGEGDAGGRIETKSAPVFGKKSAKKSEVTYW